MKIVAFDLEMSGLNADFGIVLCGGFTEWNGKKRALKNVDIVRLDEQNGYAKHKWDDRELVKQIRDRLNEADIIVSYNGRRFDIPYLNARLVYWGDDVLPKKKHVDMLYQVRYKLKLSSSRLESAQNFLGLDEHKTKMIPQIWIPAVTGDKASMDYIVDHCRRDVVVLHDVYDKLKHLITVVHS